MFDSRRVLHHLEINGKMLLFSFWTIFSKSKVVICILLPGLSGLLNALLFPAYSLHFEEMEWPLIRAGMAVTIGFVSRVLVQQMILRAGYWLAVPLCMIHLTFAILALIFTTSEWAVFAQIVCVFGIDPTCAIEGIASWFR